MNTREERKDGGSLVTLPSSPSPSVFLYFAPLPTNWSNGIGYTELHNDEGMEEERKFSCCPTVAHWLYSWSFFSTVNISTGHFRVPKTLTFNMKLSAYPFLWKWVLFAWEWKIVSISKAEHLTSFWYRGRVKFGNSLLLFYHFLALLVHESIAVAVCCCKWSSLKYM